MTTEPSRTDRLAEIREREQAATPGPWFSSAEGADECTQVDYVYPDASSNPVAKIWPEDFGPSFAVVLSDSLFVAHARADIPYLLALVAELQQENEELKGARLREPPRGVHEQAMMLCTDALLYRRAGKEQEALDALDKALALEIRSAETSPEPTSTVLFQSALHIASGYVDVLKGRLKETEDARDYWMKAWDAVKGNEFKLIGELAEVKEQLKRDNEEHARWRAKWTKPNEGNTDWCIANEVSLLLLAELKATVKDLCCPACLKEITARLWNENNDHACERSHDEPSM